MIIVKGLLIVAATIGVPIILGQFITARMESRYSGHLLANWVFGMAIMFAQLQLLAVPMIIADCRFSNLFHVYMSIIIIEVIVALSKYFKKLKLAVLLIPKKLKKGGFIGLLVILSILMQGFMLSYFEHTDDDDARYVPSAVAAIEKDIMFEENPVTGEPLYSRITEVFKDMVSPWIMFWAVLSKVCMVHPAVLMHSVVPLIFIPLSYAIYWLVAGSLFGDEHEKKLIFCGLVSAINIFSGYSVYNSGAFLLFRIWQGKALFAAIFIPLLFFMAIRFFTMDEKLKLSDYITIVTVCLGACMTSGFGIVLTAIFWGLVSVIYGISKKAPKSMVAMWFSMLPCVIYGFLYAFGSTLFM